MYRYFQRYVAVGAVSALLAISVAGCDRPKTTSGAETKPSGTRALARQRKEKEGVLAPSGSASRRSRSFSEVFESGPKPVAVLLFTGQQDGHLEPCGCSEGQKGGLARRLDLIRRLEKRKTPLLKFDLGSLIQDPATARGGEEEEKIKFGIALKALKILGYDAFALSADDLKVGVDTALVHYLDLGERPRVLAANVVAEGDLDKAFSRSLVLQAGPFKVGVTAVLDPAALEILRDDPGRSSLTVKDPLAVLREVLKDLERKSDFQVLMVQEAPPGTLRLPSKAPKKAEELAKALPGFEIVVAASEVPDPDREPLVLNGGKTFLIQVGRKGEYVGLVGLTQDRQEPMRYRLVELDPTFDKTTEPMRVLVDEEFQEALKNARVVENFTRHAFMHGADRAEFVGVRTCKECHPKTYFKWVSTKHARAFESLIANPKRDRRHDAECISCHTTGFEYETGYRSEEATPYLKGNQCENCHGAGSLHAGDPDNAAYRRALALTAERADRSRLCLRCHDADNSPNFKPETYHPRIAHKGLDTYDDPKVHKGIGPAARAGTKP